MEDLVIIVEGADRTAWIVDPPPDPPHDAAEEARVDAIVGRVFAEAPARIVPVRTSAVTIAFYDGSQSRDEKGRFGKGSGMLAVHAKGDIPREVQAKLDKKCQDLFGMGSEAVTRRMADNLLRVAEGGDPADHRWFHVENERLVKAGRDAGLPEGSVAVTMAAITSVTSGQTAWESNLAASLSIAKNMGKNTPIALSDDVIKEYNGWVKQRGKANLGPDGTPVIKAHPRLNTAELERMGGTRNADGSVSIGVRDLAEKYPDLASSKMPGPRVLSTDAMAKGVLAYKAGEREDFAELDRLVQGPKQRSFANNLADPDDRGYVTVDTWVWRSAVGSVPVRYPPGTKGRKLSAVEAATGATTQKIFQGGVTDTKRGYPPNTALYPIGAEAAKRATTRYNERNGTDITPAGLQSLVWRAARAGATLEV